MIERTIVGPAELADQAVDELVGLLVAGKEVSGPNLRQKVLLCTQLVVEWREGRPIGLAAVKSPVQSYRRKTAVRAGVGQTILPVVELGYVVVDESYRGHGIGPALLQIAAGLVDGEAFATSRSHTIQQTLLSIGFGQHGSPFVTDAKKPPLRLYVRVAT
jgi:GNAT superfamily N-acetyltransferase